MLDSSEELQKELQKRDAEYAKTHEPPAEDASEEVRAASRMDAIQKIMIPLAAEKGLEFTIEDLAEYEADMHEECELDEGELRSVAGGAKKYNDSTSTQ